MSTSVAISAAALASSSAANMAAQAARKTACTSLMDTFNAQTATIAASREYASCVQLLYPGDMSIPMWARILVAALVIGFCAGTAVVYVKERDVVYALFMGGIGGVLAVCCAAMLLAGVLFVFA